MEWEAPADPEKPRCPYVACFKLAVTLHTPPPPFGGGSYRPPGARPADGYDKLKDAGYTQTRYCVKDLKPDEVPPPPRDYHQRREAAQRVCKRHLDLEDPKPRKLVSSNSVALVVACHRDNDPSKTRYLAKIYDPLYYNFEDTEHHGVPTDVVWHAARDYSIEAAAYEESKAYETRWAATATKIPQDESKSIRGCYPAYFGSFAFKLKVVVGGLTYTRTVPLLLTEYLHGPSMEQMITIKYVKNPMEEAPTQSSKFLAQTTPAFTPSHALLTRT
ncbi:hypothetical protein VTI28DRAFT_7649 [Corynascus sepedonium]